MKICLLGFDCGVVCNLVLGDGFLDIILEFVWYSIKIIMEIKLGYGTIVFKFLKNEVVCFIFVEYWFRDCFI